jgi:AcrR family transcriptional regulator
MSLGETGEGLSRRGRGRPTEVDADRLARVALTLFLESGYDKSSMDDVAEAAQVSRRTLFRYFASKRELVWGGTTEALDRMREALAATSPDVPAMDAIRRGYVDALTFPPELVQLTRQRLKLIGSEAELRAWGVGRTEATIDLTAEFIAERTGQRPHDLGPRVAAHAVSAAATAALYWWADYGERGLPEVIDEVLRRVGRGLVD